MQPTVFASYQDPSRAEVVVGALLEAGVAPEDLSLLVHDPEGSPQVRNELAPTLRPLLLVDAGQPSTKMIGYEDKETFGSDVFEAPAGGGIDTSNSDDAIDTIDQSDRSQELAEDMIYPLNERPYSDNEARDVAEGAKGFFNTTRPEGQPFAQSKTATSVPFEEDALSPLHVPGVGYVLGGGSLSTEIIGAGLATEQGGNPAASLAEYLLDQGVTREEALELTADFASGGAIVSVASPPGTGIGLDRIEEAFKNNAGGNVMTVER